MCDLLNKPARAWRGTGLGLNGIREAIGLHLCPDLRDIVPEHDDIVLLARLVLHMIAQERFGLEPEAFENGDGAGLIDRHLHHQLLKPGTQGEELVVFVLHRSDMADFLPTATAVGRLINEHTGLEVAQVIPVKRIPKTTSGKVQRHLLEKSHIDGEFDAELAELRQLREAQGGGAQVSGSDLETRLQTICESALPGKRVDVHDNLFEIGASSLKLIEIHENIDREFPGQIDLTELFDHPTIAELAKHLESKISPPA